MTKKALLSSAIAIALGAGVAMPREAAAQWIVHDPVNNISLLQQVAQMGRQLEQGLQVIAEAKLQVAALTNIPREMIGQFTGLLDIGIANPLGQISSNLGGLLNGSGVGSCTGAIGIQGLNQYGRATGGDFLGSLLNGNSARTAGLMACTQQMMGATEQRLNRLPDLISELRSCNDVACAQAVSTRLQGENAITSSQMQQAILMGQQAQFQRWTTEDWVMQKQRADAEAIYSGGRDGSGTGTSPASTQFISRNNTDVPTFNQAQVEEFP